MYEKISFYAYQTETSTVLEDWSDRDLQFRRMVKSVPISLVLEFPLRNDFNR